MAELLQGLQISVRQFGDIFYQYVLIATPLSVLECAQLRTSHLAFEWTMPMTSYPQRKCGPGHAINFGILGPRHISELAETTDFGTLIEYVKY